MLVEILMISSGKEMDNGKLKLKKVGKSLQLT